MKIEFTARKVRLHPEVREIVGRKLAKLEKVLPRSVEAHCVVSAGKKDVSVEVTLVGRQRTWTATAAGPDQQRAAQAAMDRIEAQARKTKAKVKEKKKRAVSPARMPEVWAEPSDGDGAERHVAGPRRETIVARAMFEEDALTAFSGSSREVLVFRDPSASDAFRVLYRRRDGGLALLIPA